MPLVFTVTNPGKTPATLYLMGRTPTADFQVTDPGGKAVWSFLHGRTMMASLQVFPLGAGKSLSFRHVWNQRSNTRKPVPAGNYLVRAVLLTDRPEGLESPTANLTIG